MVHTGAVQEAAVHQHHRAALGFDVDGGRERPDFLPGADGRDQPVTGRYHQRAAVDLVHVLHDVDGVHQNRCARGLDRVNGPRILVQVLGIAAGPGDVGGERIGVVAAS